MSGELYTRNGDGGTTSLVGGVRIPKNSARVHAYGTIDEASSAIGFARASLQEVTATDIPLDHMLDFTQHRLFNCASQLATPEASLSKHMPRITAEDVTELETSIDTLTAVTGDMKDFVLPGGCETAARLHMARTVTRRAERTLLDFAATEPVDADILAFVNRLSDLLFAAARYANAVYGTGDVPWKQT